MKSLLAKTLTSTALVLVTFTAAHAFSDSKGPWPTAYEEHPRSPGTNQYFDQRAARAPTDLAASNNPFPTAAEEHPSSRSPALIRYFEQREAAIAKELRARPVKPVDDRHDHDQHARESENR